MAIIKFGVEGIQYRALSFKLFCISIKTTYGKLIVEGCYIVLCLDSLQHYALEQQGIHFLFDKHL